MVHSESFITRFTRMVLERRSFIWVPVLYALLLYPLVSLLTTAGQSSESRLLAIGMVALFAIAHWLTILRHPEWQSNNSRMGLFILAILVLTAALNWIGPNYFILYLFVCGYASRYLPLRWGFIVTLIVAALVVGRQLSLSLPELSPDAILQAFTDSASALFGLLFVVWIGQVTRQSRERQLLIEQLQATRGELAAAERQAGVLEERARLAREIHDTLAQGLTSIVMHLEAAEQALPVNQATASQHLDQARGAARDNLAEARRFVWALQPQALERDALPSALERVAQHWTDESHIPAAVSVTGSAYPLPPEFEVTLLRAAQEALANVSKHAHARQATLTLSYMGDRVMMDVNDDGVGFDLTQISSTQETESYGLAGMRQRVERLGGHLSIESEAGAGTTLVLEIPVGTSTEARI